MAKKKKPIQLLPFDYLVKIGRIKKRHNETKSWIGNLGILVPKEMEESMRRISLLSTNSLSKSYVTKCSTINNTWCIQNNWLKP